MRAILFISFLLITEISLAQNFNFSLSEKHLNKLQTYQSGHKRLKQYYRFYRKDSLDFSRKQNRKYKRELDSAFRAERKRDKLQRMLASRGIVLPDKQIVYADSLDREINRYWKVMNDSSVSDSLKALAKLEVRQLVIGKTKLNPNYQDIIDKSVGSDTSSWERLTIYIPGLDTLSALFNSSPDEFFASVEQSTESAFTQMGGTQLLGETFNTAVRLKNVPELYHRQYQSYTSKDSLQEEAKQRVHAAAIKLFQDNAAINGAQQDVSTLLSKYREFVNSSDLSTATRTTSMKGKRFREHLVVGGNFNIVSNQPLSIDLSPQLGYRFTTRFFIGIGMAYRQTFGDSIRSSSYVSPRNTSYKALINYDIIGSFYAFGEWERSGVRSSIVDNSSPRWTNNYFVGAGKRFLVHPKLYFTMTVLYNLNSQDKNPVHSNRFQVRLGFQLSELAMRKKKINYDPNR